MNPYAVLTSSNDGLTWTKRPSPFDGTPTHPSQVTGLVYNLGAGLWVASGLPGTGSPMRGSSQFVASSPDGVAWTARTTPRDATFHTNGFWPYFVATDGTLYVMDGWAPDLLTSADGITWSIDSSPSPGSTPWQQTAVAADFFDGNWEVAERFGNFDYSPDLATWTPTSPALGGSGANRMLRSANGLLFVASGTAFSAGTDPTDLSTWNDYPHPWAHIGSGIQDIAYSPSLGLYVTAGYDVGPFSGSTQTVLSSPDLTTWSAAAVDPFAPSGVSYSVEWTGTAFVLLGSDSSQLKSIARSTDGVHWTVVGPADLNLGFGVTSGILAGGTVRHHGGLLIATGGWVPAVAPAAAPIPLRQRQRDDGLISTGRVSAGQNRARSLEGSLRQGAPNTYR